MHYIGEDMLVIGSLLREVAALEGKVDPSYS